MLSLERKYGRFASFLEYEPDFGALFWPIFGLPRSEPSLLAVLAVLARVLPRPDPYSSPFNSSRLRASGKSASQNWGGHVKLGNFSSSSASTAHENGLS